MGAITLADIRRTVTHNACVAGQQYQSQGRVREVRVSADGKLIQAQVQGGARTPYRLIIHTARRRDGKAAIAGTCSCPVGYNCKHVAAALFAVQEASGGAEAIAPPETPPAPTRDPAYAPEVDAWLARLAAAEQDDGEAYPSTVRTRLLYVLGTAPAPNGLPHLRIELATIELRKDGTTGRIQRQSVPKLLSGSPPRYLRPSDQLLLNRLARMGESWSERGREDLADTLERIIATGRGRWGAGDGPAVTLGAARPAALVWRLQEDGSQRPALDLGDGIEPVGLVAPWFVEPASGIMGPIETALPPALLRTLLAAPSVPPGAAARVGAELARRMPQHAIAAPRVLDPPIPLEGAPQPHLELRRGPQLDAIDAMPWLEPPPDGPVARLSFRYGPLLVAAFETRPVLVRGGQLYAPRRDRGRERDILLRLEEIGFRLRDGHLIGRGGTQDLILPDDDDGTAWLDFMLDELPALRAAGWEIETAADFPLRLVAPDGPVEAALQERTGIDWFELELGVVVDGARVDLVPPLLELIRRADLAGLLDASGAEDAAEQPLLLPLADGRLLTLPIAAIRPTLAILFELFGAGDLATEADGFALPRSRFAELARLEASGIAAGMVWRGADALRDLARRLHDRAGIPAAALPADFRATLRPYQARGVDWLQFLREGGLGGVLADDMGLGKTVQTLAHVAIERAAGRLDHPALVVCPTSVVATWCAEAARFAPDLRVLALHGGDRKERFAAIDDSDLVITTYPLLFRDQATLTARDWHLVVLDEAQSIKNPAATTSVLARRLRAGQRLCLTGTPMENHLGELWSLFDFLMPGLLGDRAHFQRHFRTPIEKAGHAERGRLLARRVAPFLLRRTKQEVVAELPPKTEITEAVELGSGQRAIYEGIRLAMHARVRSAIAERGLARSGIIILDALLKLRQACCDPRLLKLTSAKATKAGSAKLDRLMEKLPELLEEGRRVLLFSQFTSMLALIQAALDAEGIGYVLLTGDTRDRATPVARFQSGAVPLFLISLKAGGVGLNLTAADTVIHYDPWWNPAVEDQATDRAHRIGQRNAVFVHRLVTSGTIEEKMTELKARKQALVASILGAERGTALAMTESDVEMLFAA